jgi:tRNA threonylcarbamoyladenosine biosynthesis protein TsaE
VRTRTAGETEALAARAATRLAPGDVVLVSGELGAGKTTWVRGAARALGVTGPVTSPTFTVGARYAAPAGRRVAHLDLYRLAGLEEEDPDLLAPYLGPDTTTFVEWPERASGDELGAVVLRVRLEHAGGDEREVALGWAQPPTAAP